MHRKFSEEYVFGCKLDEGRTSGWSEYCKLLIVFGKNRKNCEKYINLPANVYH